MDFEYLGCNLDFSIECAHVKIILNMVNNEGILIKSWKLIRKFSKYNYWMDLNQPSFCTKKFLFVIIYLSQIEIDLKIITMIIYEDTLFNTLGIPRLVVILL